MRVFDFVYWLLVDSGLTCLNLWLVRFGVVIVFVLCLLVGFGDFAVMFSLWF